MRKRLLLSGNSRIFSRDDIGDSVVNIYVSCSKIDVCVVFFAPIVQCMLENPRVDRMITKTLRRYKSLSELHCTFHYGVFITLYTK